MARHREARGRLVIPDPRLEHLYRALGASTTHCEVHTWDGGGFTCLSVNEADDDGRHRSDELDIIACPRCVTIIPSLPAPRVPTPAVETNDYIALSI